MGVEHNLWKKRREDVVARLVQHREGGAQVYIASSSVEPFVKSFAARFGAEAIGTPVKIVKGQVQLDGKLVASKMYRAGIEPPGVDWILPAATRTGYPLLKRGSPAAVYPDKKLKAVALERGWEIIGDTPKHLTTASLCLAGEGDCPVF
jgi:phosphoserine phosphatase